MKTCKYCSGNKPDNYFIRIEKYKMDSEICKECWRDRKGKAIKNYTPRRLRDTKILINLFRKFMQTIITTN